MLFGVGVVGGGGGFIWGGLVCRWFWVFVLAFVVLE